MNLIHFDPAILLLCTALTDQREKLSAAKKLVNHLRCLMRLSAYLKAHICDDHRERLQAEINTGAFVGDREAVNLLRPLILRFLDRYCSVHRYGDVIDEILPLTQLRGSILADDEEVVSSWMNLLGSDLLVQGGDLAPMFADDELDPLTGGTVFEVRYVIGDRRRRFRVFRSLSRCVVSLGIVDPRILARLRVSANPDFVWETTGHGPTVKQKGIIERVARKSQIVSRSVTTYHNPQGGARGSISPTPSYSEFQFTVCDGSNTIRGRYFTNAHTEVESVVALKILRDTLQAMST